MRVCCVRVCCVLCAKSSVLCFMQHTNPPSPQHIFLNSFALAVSTNRTLLWSPCRRPNCDSISRCDGLLHRAKWLPAYAEVALLLQDNCGTDAMMQQFRFENDAHRLNKFDYRVLDVLLACCGVVRVALPRVRMHVARGGEQAAGCISHASL